jgi:hypothetical protein
MLQDMSDACNYTHYAETYGTYPPKGPLPLPGGRTSATDECDIYIAILQTALEINPAFNLYRIFDVVRISHCPLLPTALTTVDVVPCALGRSWLPRLLPAGAVADLLRPRGREEGDPRAAQRHVVRVQRERRVQGRRHERAERVYGASQGHREERALGHRERTRGLLHPRGRDAARHSEVSRLSFSILVTC